MHTHRRLIFVAVLLVALGGVSGFAQESTPGVQVELRPFEAPERLLALSPDGRLLAAHDTDRLCVYDARSLAERACADLETQRIALDPESVVWSPDSTRLAFSERVFQLFRDGDLWVMAAATGALTNATDDGHSGDFIALGEDNEITGTVYADVAPAWSPDGETLAFSRSPVVDGEPGGTLLATVPAAGGDVTTLVEVADEFAVVFRGVAWSAAGAPIAYSVLHTDRDLLGNGVWTVDPTSGDTTLAAVDDPELGRSIVLSLSATGRHAIIFYLEYAAQNSFDAPVYWLLDLATGQRTPIEPPADAPRDAFVGGVVFSPDGGKLLLGIRPRQNPGALVVRDIATGADEQTIPLPAAPMLTQIGKGLDWANDGTVFAATSLKEGVLLHLEPDA